MAWSSFFHLLAVTAFCVSSTFAVGYNGLANTPPMGWVIALLLFLFRPATLTFIPLLG